VSNKWIVWILVAIIFYFIGVKFPATGQNLLTKAGV
jgi:hypothetical protein